MVLCAFTLTYASPEPWVTASHPAPSGMLMTHREVWQHKSRSRHLHRYLELLTLFGSALAKLMPTATAGAVDDLHSRVLLV